jgi:hypothetical protein
MSKEKASTPRTKSGARARSKESGSERVERATAIARARVEKLGTVARKAVIAARDGAKTAAGATTDAAKAAAQATADFAKRTGNFLDAQSRSFLEAEFTKHKPVGVATVTRLRKAHSGAKPTEIVEILSAEFMKNETAVSAESERFVTSSTHYVITLNEIYGDQVRDNTQRQVLLYLVLAANSKAAKVLAQVGVIALSFASKRFAAIATVVTIGTEFLKKSAGKMSWVSALAKLAGVSNVGRKSASWVVVNASLKILGPAPKTWPTAKTAAERKPVAKKPAATKPAARKPKSST